MRCFTGREMPNESRDAEIAELKEKIAKLEDAIAALQPLAAVGELTGTTAHEFNNILTLTINYARMGLRRTDDETREKAFNKILDASNRAAKIVAVVLGMARNRKPGREPLDLTALVDDSLLLLEREMNKYRISVEREFEPIPRVLANGNQIQQTLVNLLVNARQASPEGGRLIVRLRPAEDPKFVEMTVRDFGVGIPRERLPRIFDAFYSTKSGPDATGKGGAGLGLAFCKRVVEEHEGKIRVESAPGQGTAFIIRIPAAGESPATQAVKSEPIKTKKMVKKA
ncbi:MAG: sensor histidine kinase, partial [Thermoguttaceae bacterium]|nr:sensor histidine kinase [Thermoguttaceae bacterium]